MLVSVLPLRVVPASPNVPGACAPAGHAVWNSVADCSAETDNHSFLPKSLVSRMPGWRAQTKPGMYWPSIEGGVTSLRGVMPFEFIVASEKI